MPSDPTIRARSRAVCVGALVGAVGLTGALVGTTLAGGAGARAVAAPLPPCAGQPVDDRRAPYRCFTGATELTIAREGQALRIGPTRAKVLGSTRTGRVVRVRMKIGRQTSFAPRVPVGRRQVYLGWGGRRLDPADVRVIERDRGGAVVALRYRLPARASRRARPDLAIVPWNAIGERRPSRLGIVRLAPSGR